MKRNRIFLSLGMVLLSSVFILFTNIGKNRAFSYTEETLGFLKEKCRGFDALMGSIEEEETKAAVRGYVEELLTGSQLEMNGVILICNKEQVLCSNYDDYRGRELDKAPFISEIEEGAQPGKLLSLHYYGCTYYGSLDHEGDYDLYVFYPSDEVFHLRNIALFYGIAIEDERTKMDNHILVVEDDAAIREGVRILLEGEGYIVQEAEDGYQCLKKVSDDIDLVILDIMMPGISGIKTCEEIRKISHVPVLFLTAKSQESDKLLGLMAGGDDYLVKPFSYAELLARVKALLRRYHVYSQTLQGEKTKEHWIEYGKVKVNTQCNEVFRNEKEISLREMEYRILLLMMENPKKVFSVKNLYESLWEEPFLYSSGNTVMVHIRRLRMKIEDDPQKPKMIQTVWGKGYRLG